MVCAVNLIYRPVEPVFRVRLGAMDQFREVDHIPRRATAASATVERIAPGGKWVYKNWT